LHVQKTVPITISDYTVLGKKSGSGNALFPHPRRNQTKSRHCIYTVVISGSRSPVFLRGSNAGDVIMNILVVIETSGDAVNSFEGVI